MVQIKKVGVIGSGVMGSQIAAHIASAGVSVLLLDIVPAGAEDKSVLAKSALRRMKDASFSPFMHPDSAKRIEPGNLDEDLGKLADVDWIVEAVLEDRKVKSDLYKKIDAVRKKGSVISSNTSTIPLKDLIKGQSECFAHDFLITHFFNPPRYMRLLELVVGSKTSPAVAKVIGDFCDRQLGKGVVVCNDAPGFIANRLGIFFLQCGVNAAFDFGLTVEEADAVFSKPVGMPKTGIFGLIDLIGLDLMPRISESLLSTLAPDDVYRSVNIPHPLIDKMIADGYTGRKGRGGFYRVIKTETGKVTEAVDLATGMYRVSNKVKPDAIKKANGDIRALCETPDKIGAFAWRVLSQTLAYAATLVPQVVGDIASVDAAMRHGFNWRYGPFELIDRLGASWFAKKLEEEGREIPPLLKKAAACCSFYRTKNGMLEYLSSIPQNPLLRFFAPRYRPVVRPQGVLLLSDIKRARRPLLHNEAASLWDIGDGVVCFEFHAKMNAIDENTFVLLQSSIDFIVKSQGRYKGLVVYNEGDVFSAGANLEKGLLAAKEGRFSELRYSIRLGQKAYHALRFAPFPSVAAPAGLALGGGCEITLHCSAVQAYAETSIGLVEVGVGLIPCWGGCTQMLGRAFGVTKNPDDSMAPVLRVFDTIRHAKQSTSAFQARDLLFLRKTDGITMNRDRLLFDAKERLLSMVAGYKPPKPLQLKLPGVRGYGILEAMIEAERASGEALPHDVTVAKALAMVLCGLKHNEALPVSEAQILGFEHREFMKLERTPETAARIEHILKTGKALRN
ncbi:MAG: 3-hydroxyacyl-CoA dehydrogenase NAD-binding domain-containing protein [Alphaproteobacteria bacterium]|nr:3-hydroxyacyl-CoA dehydrogenase NAD-binding domain-containing protein [Alphaproteobacteria bacterium]